MLNLGQGIKDKILSFDYKEYKAEIKTADAQKSFKGGVTVLVTGCLTGKDNLKRKFAQSFFLAPQDNGYFVLNDVFRYVEDGDVLANPQVKEVDDVRTISINSEPGRSPSLLYIVSLCFMWNSFKIFYSVICRAGSCP